MAQTGAEVIDFEKQLSLLRQQINQSANGPVFLGYVEAHTMGTPETLTEELDELCRAATLQIQQRDHTSLQQTLRLIKEKTQEANRCWQLWKAGEGIDHVNPDLVVTTRDDDQ